MLGGQIVTHTCSSIFEEAKMATVEWFYNKISMASDGSIGLFLKRPYNLWTNQNK
jgi:hypothetical protein